MGFHTIAGVHGVFDKAPLPARRPHVPLGARTHIGFTTKSTGDLNWTTRIVKSTGAADGASLGAEHTTLAGLISSDSQSQTRITRHTPAVDRNAEDVVWSSAPLPSAQRICCMQLTHDTVHTLRHVTDPARHPNPRLIVADVLGNIYHATLPSDSVLPCESDETPAKRPRQESGAHLWHCIATASASASGAVEANAFGPLGAPGWCGLAAPTARAATDIVCCREFFFDVRLIDVGTGTVVREYGATHPPTGIASCRGMAHAVIVAEGPLATVYDTRCPGVAFTARNSHTDEGNTEEQEAGQRSKSKEELSLVTSRLTCSSSYVKDICEVSNEFELAAAVGRSLCVYDVRKWNCVSVTTNVLKYEIGAIASFAKGQSVVASGIDAEVRIVPLGKNTSNNNNNNRNNNSAEEGEQTEENASGVASFRNRIDSVVSCKNVWHGGWVPSVDETCAVGLSADNEIFLAYLNHA